ncbi:MAG TPA: histidine phosphatase family protein [Polyangiaceae bacterium]
MILMLARHGETDDNARLIFQGQGGGSLNARGRAQAERLAARLAGSLDLIVSSDLARAKETAEEVSRASGAPITFDRDVREVDVGAWTGLAYEEVERRFPEEWAAWRAGLDVPRGGGETYAGLATRVAGALERIARDHVGKRVLVVSHGAALRSAVCVALGIAPSWNAPIAGLHNTALSKVQYDDREKVHLITYNDVAHLRDLEG